MEFKSVATKRGDKGHTDSFGKGRIPKTHQAIKLVGELDLLQAEIGIARSILNDFKYAKLQQQLDELLYMIQEALFCLSGDVICLRSKSLKQKAGKQFFRSESLLVVEKCLDEFETKIPPLQNFCFPEGDFLACQFHKVRAVTRKAEVLLSAFTKKFAVPKDALAFVNRCSDLFFVLARFINLEMSKPEKLWQIKKK